MLGSYTPRGLQIAVTVCGPSAWLQMEETLRPVIGIQSCPPDAAPDVRVYAACSAAEFVAMLGPAAAVRDRAALLDLGGGIEATAAALLGVLGFLPAGASPAQLEYGLREVARGLPYAPEPYDGPFHATRERGCLTGEERQILRLVALGCTQEQMEEKLSLSRATLQRRVRALKERLGLGTRQPLSLAAVRLGFLCSSDLTPGK